MPMALLYIVAALGAHTQVSKAAVAANGFPSGKCRFVHTFPVPSSCEFSLFRRQSCTTLQHGWEFGPGLTRDAGDNNLSWPLWPGGVLLRRLGHIGKEFAALAVFHSQELCQFLALHMHSCKLLECSFPDATWGDRGWAKQMRFFTLGLAILFEDNRRRVLYDINGKLKRLGNVPSLALAIKGLARLTERHNLRRATKSRGRIKDAERADATYRISKLLRAFAMLHFLPILGISLLSLLDAGSHAVNLAVGAPGEVAAAIMVITYNDLLASTTV